MQVLLLNHEEHERHEGLKSSCLSCASWSLLKAELSSSSAQTKLMPFGYKLIYACSEQDFFGLLTGAG